MANRVGRTKKITGHIARKIFLMAGYGMTEEQIAEVIGVDRITIFRLKEDAQFSNTIAKCKAEADLRVINSLYHRAVGYSHPEEKIFCHEGEVVRAETTKQYPPDTAACALWLMNRAGWRKAEAQVEENLNKPAMIRLFSKIDGKEAAAIRQNGNQLDVLLGGDYIAEVQTGTSGTA